MARFLLLLLLGLSDVSGAWDKLPDDETLQKLFVLRRPGVNKKRCAYGRTQLLKYSYRRKNKGYLMSRGRKTWIPPELSKHWACFFLKRNLFRDNSIHSISSYKKILAAPDGDREISGYVSYFGLKEKKYAYGVYKVGHRFFVEVRVQIRLSKSAAKWRKFLESKKADFNFGRELQIAANMASDVWNHNNVAVGSDINPFQVNYRFVLGEHVKNPHFKVKLWRGGYSLYDTVISFDEVIGNGSKVGLAHEFGHMLGLIDEYSLLKQHLKGVYSFVETTFSSIQKRAALAYRTPFRTIRCDPRESIMCDGNKSVMRAYHHYIVLNRVPVSSVKAVKPSATEKVSKY